MICCQKQSYKHIHASIKTSVIKSFYRGYLEYRLSDYEHWTKATFFCIQFYSQRVCFNDFFSNPSCCIAVILKVALVTNVIICYTDMFKIPKNKVITEYIAQILFYKKLCAKHIKVYISLKSKRWLKKLQITINIL